MFTGLFAGQMIELSGVRSWLIVITDISKRKKLIADIEEQKNRLEQIIDATGVGTWEWEVKTGKVTINEEWANMLGYTLEELHPISIETWFSLMYPEDRPESDRLLQEHFRKVTPWYECDIRMIHKDGSLVWINDRGKVTQWDEEGNPVRMFGTHTDITVRKQEELDLEDSFNSLMEGAKNKSEFLSQVTHEFKTPLNIIHSLSSLLLDMELTETQKNYLRKIEKSANELYGSVSNLFDHTRIEAGRFITSSSDLSFTDLFSEIADSFSFTSEDTGLPLLSEIDPGLPEWIHSDGTILKHIITNLIGFAFKNARKGTVHLIAKKSASGDRLLLTILFRGGREDQALIQSLVSEDPLTYEAGLSMLTTKELVNVLGGRLTGEQIGAETTRLTVDFPLVSGRKENTRTTGTPPLPDQGITLAGPAGTPKQPSSEELLSMVTDLTDFKETIALNDPAAASRTFNRLLEQEYFRDLLGQITRDEITHCIRSYRFAELQDLVSELIDGFRGVQR